MKIISSWMFTRKFCIFLVLLLIAVIQGQQTYLSDIENISPHKSSGFVCNGVESSCQSYLTFRSNPPLNSAVNIANLLASEPTLLAHINQLKSVEAAIATDTLVVVPVNCTCLGNYYQHNATYMMERSWETYYSIANDVYQGLSTCEAMMAQNTINYRQLAMGSNLLVPLMCACPTRNQTASGIKYLLTYIVTYGDSFYSIAELFNVNRQSFLDANELHLGENKQLYPFTPILIPTTTQPTKIEQPVPSPPPPPFVPMTVTPLKTVTPRKKCYFLGIGTGACLLLFLEILAFVFCFYYRKSKNPRPVSNSGPKIISQWFRTAVKSLTIYKFEDLQIATGNFSQDNRIKGSVYKASLKGHNVAIKVMQGDVSSEINILKTINHSNIIRLSGFCLREGNTYLVYECADNGSLSDWFHSNQQQNSDTLQWKQRVQIAYDVANSLNYLHEYTNPPYVHKNLKASNILLDANFRAKVTDFSLARSVDNNDQYELQFTGNVIGTCGYMAPEYTENGVITPKLDIFALGVVMLELLSGRQAVTVDTNGGEELELLSASISRVLEGDNTREKLRGFIDPSLRNEYPLDLAFSMAQLAKSCVAHDLNARPSISEVLLILSKILATSDWYPYGEFYGSVSITSGR